MMRFTMVLSWNVTPRFPLRSACVLPVACVEVQAVAPTLKKFVRFENRLLARNVNGIYGPRIPSIQVTNVNMTVSIMNMTAIIPHRRPRQVTVFPCMRLVTLPTSLAFLLLPTTEWKKNYVTFNVIISVTGTS